MERVNGETDNEHNAGEQREWGDERERGDGSEREHTGDSSPLQFYPSPSQNVDSESTEIEASDSQSSDKQVTSHTPTHTMELDTAGFESVEGHSMVPGPERQDEEDTQKEEAFSRPNLPTVCTHTCAFCCCCCCGLASVLVPLGFLAFWGNLVQCVG